MHRRNFLGTIGSLTFIGTFNGVAWAAVGDRKSVV